MTMQVSEEGGGGRGVYQDQLVVCNRSSTVYLMTMQVSEGGRGEGGVSGPAGGLQPLLHSVPDDHAGGQGE